MKWRKVLTGLAGAACVALAAGAMTAGTARADTAPTSTTLTLSTNQVFVGLEDVTRLRVDVSGGNGSPAGSFGVFLGQQILCSGAVTNGTGFCNLTPNELTAGSYPLTAIYSGDENSGASGSNTETLDVVAEQPTTTMLMPSRSQVTFGQEQAEQLNVSVFPVLAGIATGTVTITASSTAGSTTVCAITLDQGDDSCTLTGSQLPIGSYQLTAHYGGGPLVDVGRTGTFAASTSTPQLLNVVPLQPTTTSLRLSAASVPFAGEQAETLTATVSAAGGGIPTGTVAVVSGSTPVCTINLTGGTGTCTLTGSQLAIGPYPLTATYSGDDTDAVSSDTSQTLTVDKEPTTTNLKLSADTIVRGSEQAELFTVQVFPATSGIPTGNVTVKAGAAAVCTILLDGGTGHCSLTSSQLRRGSYQITATYNGDTTYDVSTSTPPQTLNVVAR
jgi:hypothetical protein